MADIQKTSLPAADLKVGNSVVGETPIVATGIGFVGLCRGVTVAAHPDNEGIIYVGGANGFALKAGSNQRFEVDDSSTLTVVGSDEGQAYSWLAQ